MIAAPKLEPGHPDRDLECEMALEGDFVALAGTEDGASAGALREIADHAEAVGWQRDEVAHALQTLAQSFLRNGGAR